MWKVLKQLHVALNNNFPSLNSEIVHTSATRATAKTLTEAGHVAPKLLDILT